MEEILNCFVKDDQPDMNRQIKFIIKQLNSGEYQTSCHRLIFPPCPTFINRLISWLFPKNIRHIFVDLFVLYYSAVELKKTDRLSVNFSGSSPLFSYY